jgi:hypothetical protein
MSLRGVTVALGCLLVVAVAPLLVGHAGGSGTVAARRAVANRVAKPQTTRRTARASFLGGTYVTTTGESVTVRVSESFADADERGRRWSEFFAALPHGDELSKVTISVVTAAELSDSCGGDAFGCYRPGDLTFADEVIAGVASEEVARHEYGHHVAENRLNTPWRALDWGPKRWASVAGICAAVKAGTAFPGDEGAHYAENPSEAWAEVYRILAERTAGLPGSLWSIVVGRYYPDEAALAAAREDVLHPWVSPAVLRYTGRFVKGGRRVWQRRLATPRDGNIVLTLTTPVGPRADVTLLGADGRTVIAHWTRFTTRTRTITTSICGQRSVFVKVTRGSAPGPFTIGVSAP